MTYKKTTILFLTFLLAVISRAQSDTVTIAIQTRLGQLLQQNETLLNQSQLGLYVYDLNADSAIFAYGHQQRMRPASTEKVITATTALAKLGTDYKFSTSLYVISDTARHIKNVRVMGRMDPEFSADDMKTFVTALKNYGDTIYGDILLDMSWKEAKKLGFGWCWDDDNPSLVPLLYEGKANFETSWRQALKNAGIVVLGKIREVQKPCQINGEKEICTRFHSIDAILRPMMKNSDNQYAECVFYQLSGQKNQTATEKISRQQIENFIENNLNLSLAPYEIADGSGLSLYNYVTPELEVKFLRWAYKHGDIYTSLCRSLPVAGIDGTLKNRMNYGPAHGRIMAKTGTVTGVSSLAGYAMAPNGHLLAFCIINQGVRRASVGRQFQDRICEALTTAIRVPE